MDQIAGVGAADPEDKRAERCHRSLARAAFAADHAPAHLLDHRCGDEARQAEAEQRGLG